jgi:hypothetical protein
MTNSRTVRKIKKKLKKKKDDAKKQQLKEPKASPLINNSFPPQKHHDLLPPFVSHGKLIEVYDLYHTLEFDTKETSWARSKLLPYLTLVVQVNFKNTMRGPFFEDLTTFVDMASTTKNKKYDVISDELIIYDLVPCTQPCPNALWKKHTAVLKYSGQTWKLFSLKPTEDIPQPVREMHKDYQCANCKIIFTGSLPVCKRCRKVRLCSDECSKEFWPKHKADCFRELFQKLTTADAD